MLVARMLTVAMTYKADGSVYFMPGRWDSKSRESRRRDNGIDVKTLSFAVLMPNVP